MKIPSTRYYLSCIQAIKEHEQYDKLPEPKQKVIDKELDKIEIDDIAITAYIETRYSEKAKNILDRANEIKKIKNAKDSNNQQKTGNDPIDLRNRLLNNGFYFLDQNGEYFARVRVNDHWELLNLDSQKFSQYCTRIWEEEIDPAKLISADIIKKIINSIKSRITDKQKLETRCAEHEGAIYYDLCNKEWQQVEITKHGWRIVQDSPINFRRSITSAEQVLPEKGGSITLLDDFINLPEDTKLLLKSMLPALLVPNIARPIIMPHGEEGSGKTTLSWLIKDIIDPTTIEKQDFPKDDQDFDIVCESQYLPLFDNVHKLPYWAEDALSTMVTGRSTIRRMLYSNKEQSATTFKRGAILNGISIPIKKSDCLQRTLILKTKIISERGRKPETQYRQEYQTLKPKILGAIFDLLSKILASNEPPKINTRLKEFAGAVAVTCKAQGHSVDLIEELYQTLEDEQNQQAREASPVWDTLIELAEGEGFTGAVTQLGIKLASLLPDLPKKTLDDIKSPQWLGAHISHLSKQLRLKGVSWEESKTKTKRLKILKKVVTLSPSIDLSSINYGDKPSKQTLSPLVTLSPDDNLVTSYGQPKTDTLSPSFVDDKIPLGDKVTSIFGQKSQESVFVDFVRKNDAGGGCGREVLVAWLGEGADDVITHYLVNGVIFETKTRDLKVLE